MEQTEKDRFESFPNEICLYINLGEWPKRPLMRNLWVYANSVKALSDYIYSRGKDKKLSFGSGSLLIQNVKVFRCGRHFFFG